MIDLFRVAMSPEAIDRIAEVLTPDPFGRLYIGQGNLVEQFEAALMELLNLPAPPITTNSCTSAIDLALHLIGVGPGDAVVTTPMTCTATNSPIVTRGAIPVWADVDPWTGLIDPADVGRKITRKTKAIMAVDWGGALCDYAALKQFGVPVVQDAAHHLTTPLGDYACYSFQAIKFLTCGDGGALWCPSRQMERARLLRWYGLDRRSKADFRCEQNISEVGHKYHMSDIDAAIGLANIGMVRENIRICQGNAAYYDQHIESYQIAGRAPYSPSSSYWLYSILMKNRDGFTSFMANKGIATSQVHARNDKHAAFHFPNGLLPGVDHFDAHQINIPVGWWVTSSDREYIVNVIEEWSQCQI